MISFVDNYYRSDDNTRQQYRVFHHYLQVVQIIRRGYIFVMAAKTSSNISRFSTIIVFTSQILLTTVEAHLMFIDDTELSQKYIYFEKKFYWVNNLLSLATLSAEIKTKDLCLNLETDKYMLDFAWNVFDSVIWCMLRFLSKHYVWFVFTPTCFVGSSCFINVICIYLSTLVSNTISISDDIRVV